MFPMSAYRDGRIECTDTGIRIRGYYFPWGTKTIPYTSIRSLDRFALSALRGSWRIWGSGDFKHWANLDPRRPKKSTGFTVDLGGRVVPVITPDDPDAFERAVREHIGPGSTG
jgi:hypothetical protein